MTYEEASRLITMLQMNFAAFMPAQVEAAALKKGLWAEELQKYTYEKGMKAVRDIIGLLQYPPTIADFRSRVGKSAEMTRDDYIARLPGPTIEDIEARYSANMDRVDKMMADLDGELARLRTFDTGGKKHGNQDK